VLDQVTTAGRWGRTMPPGTAQGVAIHEEYKAIVDGGFILQIDDPDLPDAWREPDLSGDFPVDETGLVTFPKIGAFRVFEYSPAGLKTKLLDSYAVYLKNPSVEVTILRRINILGAVQKPGLYPVDPTMTIADALAIAGGASPNGDQHHVELVRNGLRINENISIDTNIAETALRSGDQLFVPERSFVVRNSGLVATAISVTASLFIALFLRR